MLNSEHSKFPNRRINMEVASVKSHLELMKVKQLTTTQALIQYTIQSRRFCLSLICMQLTQKTNFANSNTFFGDLDISGLHHVHSSIPGITIGFITTTYCIHEDAGNVSVTVSVQAGTLDRDVIVTLTTMNSTTLRECGTALKKQDLFCYAYYLFVFLISAAEIEYTPVSTNVTFNAGISTQTVTIPILDNGVVAEFMLFSVVLTSADPAVVLHPETADVIIKDDDCEINSY